MNSALDIQTTISADVDITDTVMDIAGNFLNLFADPFFVIAVLSTFMVGQFTHFVLKSYFKDVMRKPTMAIIIWISQLWAGYHLTLFFVVASPFIFKLAVFCGFMSIALYYILLGVAVKYKIGFLLTLLKKRQGGPDEN